MEISLEENELINNYRTAREPARKRIRHMAREAAEVSTRIKDRLINLTNGRVKCLE